MSFGYLPGKTVLHDVNLEIAPGESVAFVGPTVAGKSTMAKLANRFYDPTEGRVLLDGIDMTKLKRVPRYERPSKQPMNMRENAVA